MINMGSPSLTYEPSGIRVSVMRPENGTEIVVENCGFFCWISFSIFSSYLRLFVAITMLRLLAVIISLVCVAMLT